MYGGNAKRRTGSRRQAGGWKAWRSLVIPAEHGGWGFLLEPLLLGLLVAPSRAAFLLGLSTFTAFLLRHPLKLVLVDRRRRLDSPRTKRARAVIIVLVVISGACFLWSVWLAGPALLFPLVLAVPFGAVYLYYDLTRPGRTLLAELAGPLALAFVASSMAIMDGWPLLTSLALWAALGLRSVPSVLYVRARIRLDRGRNPSIFWPVAAHVLAVVAAGALISFGLVPALAIVSYTVLLVRALWFLSPQRLMVKIKTIGFVELAMGLFLVATLAIGYTF